jgi:hypothetical protein
MKEMVIIRTVDEPIWCSVYVAHFGIQWGCAQDFSILTVRNSKKGSHLPPSKFDTLWPHNNIKEALVNSQVL